MDAAAATGGVTGGRLTRLPLIYIAGPFRGPTPYDVRRNVERARDVGLTIAQMTGAYPIIPHTMTSEFDKLLTDEFWLQGTLEMLRRCDAVYLMDNWRLSSGARAERDDAMQRDQPVFDNLGELTLWVKRWKVNWIAAIEVQQA